MSNTWFLLQDLSYKDKHWHEACFACSKCHVSLVDRQFGSKADKIYCGNCFDAQFAARCDGCTQIFRAGELKELWKFLQPKEEGDYRLCESPEQDFNRVFLMERFTSSPSEFHTVLGANCRLTRRLFIKLLARELELLDQAIIFDLISPFGT